MPTDANADALTLTNQSPVTIRGTPLFAVGVRRRGAGPSVGHPIHRDDVLAEADR